MISQIRQGEGGGEYTPDEQTDGLITIRRDRDSLIYIDDIRQVRLQLYNISKSNQSKIKAMVPLQGKL